MRRLSLVSLSLAGLVACASSPPPEAAPPLAEPAASAAPARPATTAAASAPAASAAPAPGTAAPAALPEVKLDSNYLRISAPVTFETGSDKLTAESTPALEAVKKYLDDKSYISKMRIEGHTDEATPDKQALSEKRALSVVRWLVAHGVDCKRLIAVGFGATKPVASNATPEGKAQNRRIEFVNAELRGKAIGGAPLDGGGKGAGEACK